ncbi:DsbA family protein [Halolamina sp.]|jgi:predicted DsbA family dithiol-disulfide isomerase|uniref:DsbA family oxidoreductase n=1 Tax=Halolamina sp. TaxID=1940283 RepID=UPI000223B91D|nr:DSBA oxidoreductase [halophilic archaeon DL31]
MSTHDARPTLYSDYACPFCYLEHRTIAEYRRNRDAAFELDWQPYDIRHRKRGPTGELEAGLGYPDRVHREIDRLKQQRGETGMLDLDRVPHVDSLNAQVASRFISDEQPNRWAEFDSAVFEALWLDGRNINDVETVARIAGEVGLAEDGIRDALGSAERRSRLLEEFTEARTAGITDVPTLRYNGETVQDVLSVAELQRFVETV